MNDIAIKLLRRIRKYVSGSSEFGAHISNAVYISSAQQLRNQANEMEAKDRLLAEIDQFLNETKETN